MNNQYSVSPVPSYYYPQSLGQFSTPSLSSGSKVFLGALGVLALIGVFSSNASRRSGRGY